MTIIFLTTISFLTILISKIIFQKWFNHIALYTGAWYLMLLLYELRMMRYIDLSATTWIAIIGAFLSFIFGSVMVVAARNVFIKDDNVFQETKDLGIFADDGRIIRIAILISSIIGILSAIQHWMVLIKKFGSIASAIIQANLVYRLRTSGELEGVIPYVYIIAYVGVFLSGIYIAYKNKVTILSALPFIAVIMKEIGNASRAGMLISIFLFVSSYFLTKHLIVANKNVKIKKNKTRLVISVAVLISLFILAAGLVRTSRGAIENYSAASRSLSQYKGGFFITPSLYLYFSSHVGVLSQYLEKDFYYTAMFGETTFQPIYNFLSKFEIVKHPLFYEKGYFMPMWSNTATYIRPLHADFGIVGIYIVPFILGFSASFYWFKFFEKRKTIYLVILSYLYVVIMFSFLTMITRSATWLVSFVLLLLVIPFMEKRAIASSKMNLQKNI
ncbi:MAG: O-antigen ligase [Ignavibacteriales bacterium]|nr:O-antigen ligase [Ignavibacteriales bacterium]